MSARTLSKHILPISTGFLLIYLMGIKNFWGYDFKRFPGDRGDARLQSIVLEHNYRFWTGKEDYLFGGRYFFPLKDELLLSDSFTFVSLPYILMRFLGISRELSFSMWMLIGIILKLLISYYVFLQFRIKPWIAIIGSAIFSLSAPVMVLLDPKTTYIFLFPLIYLEAYRFVESLDINHLFKAVLYTSLQTLLFVQGGVMTFTILPIIIIVMHLLKNRSWKLLFRFKTQNKNYSLYVITVLSLLVAFIYLLYQGKYVSTRAHIAAPLISYITPSLWSLPYGWLYSFLAKYLGEYDYLKTYSIGYIVILVPLSIFLIKIRRMNNKNSVLFHFLIFAILSLLVMRIEAHIPSLIEFILVKVATIFRYELILIFIQALILSLILDSISDQIRGVTLKSLSFIAYLTVLLIENSSTFQPKMSIKEINSDIEPIKKVIQSKMQSHHKVFVAFLQNYEEGNKAHDITSFIHFCTACMYIAQEIDKRTIHGYATFCPPGGICYNPAEFSKTKIDEYLRYHGISESFMRDSIVYIPYDEFVPWVE